MLPEVLTSILKALQAKREYAEAQFRLAIGSDRGYYAGQSAAYTLAIGMLSNGPETHEDTAS